MFSVFIFLVTFGGFVGQASATFIPESQIDYTALSIGPSQIGESEFRSVIADLQRVYGPIVTSLGGRLYIQGDWKSDTLNAGANQMFGNWAVRITGGLARRPELTADGFTLIVCHELGHHLGGFPYADATPMIGVWAANEDQADYFSTQVCAKKMWSGEVGKNADFAKVVSVYGQQACDSIYADESARHLCYRTTVAIESLTATMGGILQKPAPHFETPDATVVSTTSNAHPAIQCRMDTTVSGALCPALWNESVIPGKKISAGTGSLEAERESATTTCTQSSGYAVGLRPACWYKARL